MGITLLWIALYGIGFLLSLLPSTVPAPDRLLTQLPSILRGNYDFAYLGDLILLSIIASLVAGLVGLWGFAKKDV
jgi:ABC-2 type transport system permease protein